MLNSTKKMMQRCKTFRWNWVSPLNRSTSRCSRRIRLFAIERTRVSSNARQTPSITGRSQGLTTYAHHSERLSCVATCFGWESIIMADLLGFHTSSFSAQCCQIRKFVTKFRINDTAGLKPKDHQIPLHTTTYHYIPLKSTAFHHIPLKVHQEPLQSHKLCIL